VHFRLFLARRHFVAINYAFSFQKFFESIIASLLLIFPKILGNILGNPKLILLLPPHKKYRENSSF